MYLTLATQGYAAMRKEFLTLSGPVSQYQDLGSFARALPDSNEPFCVLNHRRGLALARPTAAPASISSAYL